jgi:AcrR family transcriptional regulator
LLVVPVRTTCHDDGVIGASPPSLRERKKAKTRKVLADTATELFAEQGFDHTTVEAIAEACEVSPRTFFRYFSSKEDVLFAAGDERLRQLLDAIASRPSGEAPLRSMREAALSLVPEYTSDRAQLITRKRITAETQSLRSRGLERQLGWEDAVTDAFGQRITDAGPATIELRLVASVTTATLRAALHTWLEAGGDLATLIDDAFDRLSRGLEPSPTSPSALPGRA